MDGLTDLKYSKASLLKIDIQDYTKYEYICKFKWDQTNNEDMVMQIINLKNIIIDIIKTAYFKHFKTTHWHKIHCMVILFRN